MTIAPFPTNTNQAGGQWLPPDLSILTGGQHPAPRFPLQLFAPELSVLFTSLAGSKGAPPDYVAAGILGVAASLIGNARWVEAWPGWREPCCLWLGAVGGPSSAKSPGFDPALTIARDIEAGRAEGHTEEIRRWETDVEKAKLALADWQDDVKTSSQHNTGTPQKPLDAVEPEKPPRPRAVVMDSTVEQLALILAGLPKGTLNFRDELSGFLGSHGRYGGDADRPFYLEAYGGRSFAVDRVRRDEPIIVPRLTLSILGGIQPDRLETMLMKADNDGLAARFLFVWPEPIAPIRPRGGYDLSLLRHALTRLDGLEMIEGESGPEPAIMMLSNDAADLHDERRQTLFADHGDAPGMFGSFIGKAPGMVLRLSAVLTLLEWAITDDSQCPDTVSADALRRTWAMFESYLIPMAKRVYGNATIPTAERHAKALAKRIMENRELRINARAIQREWRIPGLNNATAIQSALSVLMDTDWLREETTRTGNSPGRSRRDYAVNPDVFAEW